MSAFRKNAGIIHPTTEVRWLSDSGDRKLLRKEGVASQVFATTIMKLRKLIFCVILSLFIAFGQENSSFAQKDSPSNMQYAEKFEFPIDPLAKNMNDVSLRFSVFIFNKLASTDVNNRIQPELLESLTPSFKQGAVYTFHLKKGIKWVYCDKKGEVKVLRELVPNDVIYTFNRIKNADTYYDNINKVFQQARFGSTKADPNSFELTLTKKIMDIRDEETKNIMIQKALCFPIVPDLSKDAFECAEIKGEKIVGTGSFVARKSTGRSIELVRNLYYFGQVENFGKYPIDEIEMQHYPDLLLAINDLTTPANQSPLHLIPELPLKRYKEVLRTPNIKIAKHSINNITFFAYNCSILDRNIRQAFTYAIDRKKMLITGYGEIVNDDGKITNLSVSEIMEIIHTPIPRDDAPPIVEANYSETGKTVIRIMNNDPEEANRLRRLSTFRGSKIKLLTYNVEEADDLVIQSFRDNIKQILNIEIEVQSVGINEWRDLFYKKDFEIAYGRWTFPQDADILQDLFDSQSRYNVVQYTGIDKQLKEYAEDKNPEERVIKKDKMAKLIAEDAPYTFLFRLPKCAAYRNDLIGGVILHPYEFFNFVDQWYMIR
jgi:ABC-type transport system substrate-binding protein